MDGQMVRIVPMRAQKMRIQMAQFEWSDGSVWMVWMLVQMKVMMVPIRWLEMRAQMAVQMTSLR